MKNKTARILAIIALVFMGIFVVTLVMTLVDYTMLNNGIGFIALGSGVFVLAVFFALRADGRGFSMTDINRDIEMKKLEAEAERQKEADEKSEEHENTDTADGNEEKGDKPNV